MLFLNTWENEQWSTDHLSRLLFGHILNILVSITLMSMRKKLLLFYTEILKIVDRDYATFKCVGQMRNDLRIICLAYCLVITSIL